MIGAGKLRHSITFYDRSDNKESDYGSVDESFAEGITCRAAVKFMSGSETMQSQTMVNITVVQFTIRYRSGVTETQRILWQGDYYAVKVIEQDEKQTTQIITTTKIVT